MSTRGTDPASPEHLAAPTASADPSAAAAAPRVAVPSGRPLGRRALLLGGAATAGAGALLGAGAALGIPALLEQSEAGGTEESDTAGFAGEHLPCHGPHQTGVTTPAYTHVRYLSYTLHEETDAAALTRMFRILTDDIEGLASGTAPLADPEPELAARPARLTVTLGVGQRLVERVPGAAVPAWLGPLPEFSRDELDPRFSGGDLLIVLQADEQMAISHAARMFARDLRSFATPAWTQQGFTRARGAEPSGTTMRNLMGQVDGTVNPLPADDDFASLVWLDEDSGWLAGGSALVFRRIRMELDTWDIVDRPGREQTIGRTLSDGAPLTGGTEHTPTDFAAVNANGLPVIPSYAHIRRAHSTDPSERIYRRSVNYDNDGEAGLLFACYQRDPARQFIPIQQRLDELDLLNEWVTHTGSAVFAVLPGFRSGEMIGASLLAPHESASR